MEYNITFHNVNVFVGFWSTDVDKIRRFTENNLE